MIGFYFRRDWRERRLRCRFSTMWHWRIAWFPSWFLCFNSIWDCRRYCTIVSKIGSSFCRKMSYASSWNIITDNWLLYISNEISSSHTIKCISIFLKNLIIGLNTLCTSIKPFIIFKRIAHFSCLPVLCNFFCTVIHCFFLENKY